MVRPRWRRCSSAAWWLPNVGRDEFEVAAQAGAAHIPISTISFGTPYGTVDIQGEQAAVPVDDDSLAKVAALSGGEFYPAQSNQQIHQVYATLGQQIGYQTIHKDVSKPCSAASRSAA